MQQIQFKQDSSAWLVATTEHPFWTEEEGWRMTRYLKPGHTLQLANDGSVTVIDHTPLRPTSASNVVSAWHDDGSFNWLQHDHKQHWQTYQPDAENLPEVDHHSVWQAQVYNFAVEGFHTYYVGEAGVWVYNVCPGKDAMDKAEEIGHEKNLSPEEIKKFRDQDLKQKQVSTCFAKDTFVHCKEGPRRIQFIDKDDLVLARCDQTGRQEYRRVLRRYEHWEGSDFIGIEYWVRRGEELRYDGLRTTAEHPFWVVGQGWTKAEDIKIGQEFEICDPDGRDAPDRQLGSWEELALSGQRWQAKVVAIEKGNRKIPVFNLEVEGFHSYFVGAFGVWVHNKNEST